MTQWFGIVGWLVAAALFVWVWSLKRSDAHGRPALLKCATCRRRWVWHHRRGEVAPERCPECLMGHAIR